MARRKIVWDAGASHSRLSIWPCTHTYTPSWPRQQAAFMAGMVAAQPGGFITGGRALRYHLGPAVPGPCHCARGAWFLAPFLPGRHVAEQVLSEGSHRLGRCSTRRTGTRSAAVACGGRSSRTPTSCLAAARRPGAPYPPNTPCNPGCDVATASHRKNYPWRPLHAVCITAALLNPRVHGTTRDPRVCSIVRSCLFREHAQASRASTTAPRCRELHCRPAAAAQ